MQNVFIFGAGASYGWSFGVSSAPPITSKFFSGCREAIRLRSGGFESRWPCFGFLKRLYGLPPGLTPFRLLNEGYYDDINLEDAATRLFRASLKGKPEIGAYNNFKLLIAVTMGKPLKQMRGTCRFHDLIVKNHILARDVIVSFNYDWVLEKSLKKRWPSWGQPGDYGWGRERRPNYQNKKLPLLLKPHGSLDWQIRSKRFKLADRAKFSVLLAKRKVLPASIGIIPPVLMKDEEERGYLPEIRMHYDEIWNRIDKAISRAKKIVFIGYSLPRGDTRAYRTILSAAAKRACKIEIVNPEGARLRDELSLIFGKNSVKWEYTSLEAYSKVSS